MPQYGPTDIGNIVTEDLVAPGAPVLTDVIQLNNKDIRVEGILPDKDANGDNLTKLTKVTVATRKAAEDPYAGKAMADIIAAGDVSVDIALTPAQAGQPFSATIPLITPGETQWIAAACMD